MAYYEMNAAENEQGLLKKSKILKREGKHQKALVCLENLLKKSQKKDQSKLGGITHKIVKLCNSLFETSTTKVPYLRKAENIIMKWVSGIYKNKFDLTEKMLRTAMTTFTNWASFHRTGKNYQMALSYLLRGISLSKSYRLKESDSFHYLSKMRFNMSCIYFELQSFEESVFYSEQGLESLQKELKIRLQKGSFEKMNLLDKQKFIDMISMYVLCFYNIFLAQEALNKRHLMKQALINAVEIGSKYLNKNDYILSTVKSALNEMERSPLHRSMITIDFEEAGPKKSPLESGNRLKVSQLSLGQSVSECKLIKDPPSLNHHVPDIKLPGRYYSAMELEQKQKNIQEHQKLGFISADQFFFQEISKAINIKSDLKHLKPSNSMDPKGWIKQENSEKRIISGLRLRKQYRSSLPLSPIPLVSEQIKSLRIEEKEQDQVLQKKIGLITNSLECKALIRQICDKGEHKKYFPIQSKGYLELFFKPKVGKSEDYEKIDISRQLLNEKLDEEERNKEREKRKSCYQSTKDEIESLIDIVTEEINHLTIDKESSKLVSPSICYSTKSYRESSLSKSALRLLTDSDKHYKILKSAIGKAVRVRKRTTKCKKISRTPKIIDLEV